MSLKEDMFTAVPDTVDFRDILYTPRLRDLPKRMTLEDYKKKNTPEILDQHEDYGLGKCIGFALATVCNHLIKRNGVENGEVSPHMLYHMAKRYSASRTSPVIGASARSAIKGWQKHGVCSEAVWNRTVDKKRTENSLGTIKYKDFEKNHMKQIANNAASRPLGTYRRVNHKELNAIQTAIADDNILFATAIGHDGWDVAREGKITDGEITFVNESDGDSGHAFVIVGYDKAGFWIQNSWGKVWGLDGYGHLSYADWLKNGLDVWVASLGVYTTARKEKEKTNITFPFEPIDTRPKYNELRSHIIDISNNVTETKEWSLNISSATDEADKQKQIEEFKSKPDKNNHTVLIVKVTAKEANQKVTAEEANQWTIAMFNDEREFINKELTDTNNELAIALNKEEEHCEYSEYTIIDLATAYLDVTLETSEKQFSVTKSDIDSILDEFIDIANGNNSKEEEWKKKRLLLYAPNFFDSVSLVSDQMNALKDILTIDAEVYPLAVIWRDEYWTTLYNLLSRAKLSTHPGVNNGNEGIFDQNDNFLIDRYDYTADIFTANIRGNKEWLEMKRDTFRLKKMHLLADSLASRIKANKIDEIHIVGHGAGAIFLAAFVRLFTLKGQIAAIPDELKPVNGSDDKKFQGKGCTIESCTLWAPACTIELFNETFLPAIDQGKSYSNGIKKFNLFTLSEEAEQDDSFFQGYDKSFLYYISNALENKGSNSYKAEGKAILGMRKFAYKDTCVKGVLKGENNFITTPNFSVPPNDKFPPLRTYRHDDFSNDMSILNATLDCIVGKTESDVQKKFNWRKSGERIMRRRLKKQIASPRHTGRSIRITQPSSGGD